MERLLGNFLQQIILVVFYVAVIILAVKLGVAKAKKKNLEESKENNS